MSAPNSLPLRRSRLAALDAHDDALGVDLVDHAPALGEDDRAGVAGHRGLQAGADERRLDLEQGHGLALHVGAHQRAVRVVVLEERDQRRRDGDELLGRDVLVVDLVPVGRDELAVEAGDDAVLLDAPGRVRLGVGLGDDVVLFLPGREVEGERLSVGGPLVVACGRARSPPRAPSSRRSGRA